MSREIEIDPILQAHINALSAKGPATEDLTDTIGQAALTLEQYLASATDENTQKADE